MSVNSEHSSKSVSLRIANWNVCARPTLDLIITIAWVAVFAGVCSAGPVADSWDSLFGVAFGGSGRAYVVGSKGLLLESNDSGETWKKTRLGEIVRAYDLYGVRFAHDGANGWIVGEHGAIYHTSDGGKNWNKQSCPIQDSLFKVTVLNADQACAVGANGVLVCTQNGGVSWTVNRFKDFTFFDVTSYAGSGLWAVGEYKSILFSSDWGKHWQLVAGGQRVFTAPPYFAISLMGDGDGVLAALGPSFERTSNGGKSWSALALKDSHQVYVIYPDTDGAITEYWIAGGQGYVGQLRDDHLTRIETGATTDLTDIGFEGDTGLAVGVQGTLVRLHRGDGVWRVSESSTLSPKNRSE
jgi:photosystem II stability/assembly factor-like uncharacterized protein